MKRYVCGTQEALIWLGAQLFLVATKETVCESSQCCPAQRHAVSFLGVGGTNMPLLLYISLTVVRVQPP